MNNTNIFIVEDDSGLANLVKRYLNRENIDAEIFLSGNEALQAIKENPPGIVLLDYKLNDCSATYFIERLKEIDKKIEFIVMTGFGDERLAVQMMKLGAVDYLIKDDSFRQLIIPVVKQALEKVNLKSELILSEKALKETEAEKRIILETVSELVVYYDTDFKIKWANPAFMSYFSKSSSNTVNCYCSNIWQNACNDKSECKLLGTLTSGENNSFERKTHDDKIWAVNCYPIRENNQIIGVVKTAIDITERKIFENELIKKEKDYRGLFENAHDAIIIFEPESEVLLDVNQQAAQLFGYTKEELIGMSIKDISKDVKRGEKQVKLTLERGAYHNFVTTQYKKSGQEMILEINASVIDYKGKKAILSINRDITQRVKAEKIQQTLFNISYSSNNSKSIDELVSKIIIHLNEIVDTKNFYVALYQESTDTLKIQYQAGGYHDYLEIPAQKTFSKYVINTKKPLLANNTKIGELIEAGEVKIVEKTPTEWIGVPLTYENNIFGVLAIQDYEQDDKFSIDDLKILEFTAEHVAVALNRKQSEDALKAGERKYREIFNSTSDAIFIHDAETSEIVDINKSVEVLTGFSREEFFSADSLKLLKKHFRLHYRDIIVNFRKAVREDTQNFSVPAYQKNGNKVWVDIVFKATEIGGKKRVLAVSRDITERKLAVEELEKYKNELELIVEKRTKELLEVNNRLKEEIEKQKKSEIEIQNQLSFLKSLIDAIPIPIFIKDQSKKYINCNKSFEELIGKNKKNIIGKNSFDIVSLNDAVSAEEIDEKLLNKPGNIIRERQLKAKGKIKSLITFNTTFNDHHGKVAGIIGAMLDITQQKEMEKQLKVSLEKEKELNQLKSRFISTASHEFRTPLTAILSSIDLLEINRKKNKLDRYQVHIDKVKRSIHYMTELLDDVLTMNRTETGKLEFRPEYFSLNIFVREIFEENMLAAGDKHKMKLNLPKNLKEIYADKKLLKLIMSNLLSNAIKYSPEGGEIIMDVKANDTNLFFTISDEGCGIPKEDQVTLFEPFHRGTNVENIVGTGLGLSITKKSVELHKGIIDFESHLDKGTIFKVTLPVFKNSN